MPLGSASDRFLQADEGASPESPLALRTSGMQRGCLSAVFMLDAISTLSAGLRVCATRCARSAMLTSSAERYLERTGSSANPARRAKGSTARSSNPRHRSGSGLGDFRDSKIRGANYKVKLPGLNTGGWEDGPRLWGTLLPNPV